MCQAKVIIVFDCKLRRRASRNENKIEKISTSWKEKKSIDLNKQKIACWCYTKCGNTRKVTGMEQTRARKNKLDGKITSSKSKH